MSGSSLALLFLTFALHFTKLLSTDTLVQGSNFTRGDSLISSQFELRFFSMPFTSPDDDGKLYLGVTFGENRVVWVANLDNPVDYDSDPRLIIDDHANMRIVYNADGGSEFIMIYPSSEAQPSTASAVLEENGNFILQETLPDGTKKQLWQSFVHQNNILFPQMSIGFNSKTGEVWNLTSWVGPSTPALGSFTLGMHPNDTKQLIIWWHGKPHWTSGPMDENGRFPNLRLKSTQQDAFFTHNSNENETYFFYVASSAELDAIVLDSMGQLGGGASVSCNTNDPALGAGCVPLEGPTCRNPDDYVSWGDPKLGYMSKTGYKIEGTENVALYDCGAMCFSNCSCFYFSPTTKDNTGCEMWVKGIEFAEYPQGRPIYLIRDAAQGKSNLIHLFIFPFFLFLLFTLEGGLVG